MHRLVAAILAGVLVHSASARDLQIRGVAGYLSEYELSADVAQRDGEAGALSGPLTVRHVGVCTHDGPDEMLGRLQLRFTEPRRVEASLSYEGRECLYRGVLSDSETGFMTCNDKLTLPVRLWTK